MAKIKRGYTRKEPSIPKASPHKDFPVLKDKAPDRPKKSKRGSRYRPASLSSFNTGERAIANAENKPKRTGWGRFFRVGGGGSDSPGQPGLKHGKKRREPKLQ